MRDERAEVEGHVLARLDAAEGLTVEVDVKLAVELAVPPPVAQRIGGHEHGRKGAGRLGLEEAEALRQLAGDQPTQRHVVGQADEADCGERLFTACAQRYVASHDDDLRLHVAAPALVAERDRIAGAEEAVRSALIHQRIVPEALRHLGTARLAHQGDVVHIRRAVRPLIGARQRRGGVMFVEAFARDHRMLQVDRQILEVGQIPVPIVERRLQGRHDMARIRTPGEVVRDDDEPAVTLVLQTGEFHRASSFGWAPMLSSAVTGCTEKVSGVTISSIRSC